MIRIKTAAQKKADLIKLNETAHKCAKALETFIKEVYQAEFHLEWLQVGTINKMQDIENKYKGAKVTEAEAYTFTSYDEDSEHKEWNNATYITEYRIKGTK